MKPTSNEANDNKSLPAWRKAGHRFYSYNYFLRQRYGVRVQKVSIDAGFTCPNVDGTVTTGGCTFCDNRSFSPSRRVPRVGVTDQIEEGIRRLQLRYQCDHFTAYFQPATNTYAPVEQLRALYQEALAHPQVLALAIGTRPDCVPDPVMGLLEEISESSDLSVEYGIQTIHNRSLDWMNRGHHHDISLEALHRSVGRGFEVCVHIILGIPGETREDMLDTARAIASLPIDAVKIHNLYAVKNTVLADQIASGEVTLMEQKEYVTTLVDFLELLPSGMVVERISGDAPRDYFVGPAWCLNKSHIRNAVNQELANRDSWQGKYYYP
ncbi:MAG: TIGR01212 family radical SAM protein [Planctomycetes bacterium]|nr:TIGR01212 family radical SAM protein [Planctomycetota bacterium]